MHSNKGQATWESVKDGLRYVFSTKELLGAITLDMFAVLFGGAVAMLPFFAGDILHAGTNWFWLVECCGRYRFIRRYSNAYLLSVKEKAGPDTVVCCGRFWC